MRECPTRGWTRRAQDTEGRGPSNHNKPHSPETRATQPTKQQTTNRINHERQQHIPSETKPHEVLDKQCMIETPNNQTVGG